MTEATLFVNGRVFTGARSAEALLVENGRVVAVGPEASVRPWAPTGAARVDLEGGLVVPGLADAHLHLGEMARARAGFDAGAYPSVDKLLAGLQAWGPSHPGPAVVGRGLDLERLSERRWPSRIELDRAERRPVVLFHVSGHAAVLNSAAVERLSAEGAAVPGAPEAAHVLLEEGLHAVAPIVEAAVPLTPEMIERAAREVASLGVTAVGTMNASDAELRALRQLDQAGRLPVRVRAYPPLARVREIVAEAPAHGTGRFAVVGVKGFLDGAFGPRTASLEEPYDDDPGNRGIDRGEDVRLRENLLHAGERGLAPALHAIGDRAVARAARLLEAARTVGGGARIEHASLTPPATWAPLRGVRPTLVVQPGFLLTDLWLRERLGPERARWAYAFRALADQGLELAGSSDAPFDAPDPWRGIRAAVRRTDELGRSANPWPDQALPAEEALALYTLGAPHALGLAGGRLEPGAAGDVVVLRAPDLASALRTGAATVRSTWVAGHQVASGPSAAGRGA